MINLSLGEQVSASRINETIQFLSPILAVEPDTLHKTALDYGKLIAQGPMLDSHLV